MSSESNNTDYDINILTGIAFCGLSINNLFYQKTSTDGIDGPANSVIWGYGVVLLSLLGMMYITFSLATKSDMNSNTIQFIKTIFNSSFPVLFLMILLIWIITMNIYYKTRINKGQVSKDYYMFNMVSSILTTLNIIIVLSYISDLINSKTSVSVNTDINPLTKTFKLLSSQMASIGYAIGIVNYLIVFILQIILEYFSTDG